MAKLLPRSRSALWLTAATLLLLAVLLVRHVLPPTARAAMVRADPDTVLADPALAAVALPLGRSVFARHCARCHGIAGEADAARGVPSLRDGEHLYGEGRVAEIESIVRHGIRSGDRKGWNLAAMPAYASARPYAAEPIPPLTPQATEDVTQFLLGLARRSTDDAAATRGTDDAAAARGRRIYGGSGGCWDCHGVDARGDPAVGAPDLADPVWLYGGTAAAIRRSIAYGRGGTSPAFARTLDAAAIRAVSAYVASLSAPPPETP